VAVKAEWGHAAGQLHFAFHRLRSVLSCYYCRVLHFHSNITVQQRVAFCVIGLWICMAKASNTLQNGFIVIPRLATDWEESWVLGVEHISTGFLESLRTSLQWHLRPRIPHSLDNRLTDGAEAVSLTRRPRYTCQNIFC
jgi:hypothetical protein